MQLNLKVNIPVQLHYSQEELRAYWRTQISSDDLHPSACFRAWRAVRGGRAWEEGTGQQTSPSTRSTGPGCWGPGTAVSNLRSSSSLRPACKSRTRLGKTQVSQPSSGELYLTLEGAGLARASCQGSYLASPRGIAVSHPSSQWGKLLETSSDKGSKAPAVPSGHRAGMLPTGRGTSRGKTISIVCRGKGVLQIKQVV